RSIRNHARHQHPDRRPRMANPGHTTPLTSTKTPTPHSDQQQTDHHTPQKRQSLIGIHCQNPAPRTTSQDTPPNH
ncbi:hypothetical protein, partial [Streptomyces sp. NBC_00062]|uniref:hypothetical protein n=1 Tax=Streptomyces sp. NBC_00062 TaxID=2975637 RepID=UPI002255705E